MLTFGSLFSGCGGADFGGKFAGFSPQVAVEKDLDVARLYRQNLHHVPIVDDILNVVSIPAVNWLHLSPPCQNFSGANVAKTESILDIALSLQAIKLAIASQPDFITIENVPAYGAIENRIFPKTKSFQGVLEELNLAKYKIVHSVLKFQDYGLAQNRQRFFLIASKNYPVSLPPKTHIRGGDHLLQPHASWYEVLESFLPDREKERVASLPKNQLTQKQIESLQLKPSKNRPILIQRCGYQGGQPSYREKDDLAFCLRSHLNHDGKGSYRTSTNILTKDECFDIDIKALAALQGFPSFFRWGENKVVAAKAIGNAVPPLFMQAVGLHLAEIIGKVKHPSQFPGVARDVEKAIAS
ncbi:MAG: DNA cytosine methyltransferase [Chroococcidiopsis sp.]